MGGLTAIKDATLASSGVAWLSRSIDEDGSVVDDPQPPFLIPLDTTAVNTSTFAPFLSQPARRRVLELKNDQGILSESSARLRHLHVGARLEFEKGVIVKVAAILPDVEMGAFELLVPRQLGHELGIDDPTYVLFTVAKDTNPTIPELTHDLTTVLPPDEAFPEVQVRLPGEVKYLRPGDEALPMVAVKRRFGEFAARPDPFDQANIEIDPSWIERMIGQATIPVLGTVECNKKLPFLLHKAARQIEASGAAGSVAETEGCFLEEGALADPIEPISLHAWGAAIDVDADLDPAIEDGKQDPKVVQAMQRWGFLWGGDLPLIEPAPHHYEYRSVPENPAQSPTPSASPAT